MLIKKRPDSRWVLGLLAWLDKDCPIFRKGYVPPKREYGPHNGDMLVVDNADGLLSDLHPLSRRELGKGRGNLFLTKAQKLQHKLARKEARLQQMVNSVAK